MFLCTALCVPLSLSLILLFPHSSLPGTCFTHTDHPRTDPILPITEPAPWHFEGKKSALFPHDL